jgi:cytosine deaminase
MMWNPWAQLLSQIESQGGFQNVHAHLDRAYSVSWEDFENKGVLHASAQEKGQRIDQFKKEQTQEGYYKSICIALSMQKDMGVSHCLSFIDCDPVVEQKALKAALKAKEFAARELKMRFLIANQVSKGVLEPEARRFFELGFPRADQGREAEHLDVLFKAGKEYGKRLHVHVDSLYSSQEKETELLARKAMEWGMEGHVTAIHAVSLGAHKKEYRKEVIKMCLDAQLSFIACPTACMDSCRNEVQAPFHHAVTPIDELIPAGLIVALGSGPIADIYKPYSDGNMAVELRILLESTRFYDQKSLVDMSTINGLKVLGGVLNLADTSSKL